MSRLLCSRFPCNAFPGALLAVLILTQAGAGQPPQGAGDSLPPGVVARLGTPRFVSGGPPVAAALSRDHTLLASSSQTPDNALSLWDVSTGRALHRLKGHGHPVHALAFSPDGKHLYSGNDGRHPVPTPGNNHLLVWEAATGKEVRRFPCRAWALSGDGKVLAVAVPLGAGERPAGRGGFDVHFLDTESFKKLRTFHEPKEVLVALALSPDGKRFAYSCSRDGTLRVVESDGAKVLHRLEGPPGHVHLLAFSPDGTTLASVSNEPAPRGRDRQIVLWDVGSGKARRRLAGHPHPVGGLAFSPDGQTLVSFSERDGVRQWDAATGGEVRRVLDSEAGRAVGAAFSADGERLTTIIGMGHLLVPRDWDVRTGAPLPGKADDAEPYRGLMFAPDGRTLAVTGQGSAVHLFDVAGKLAGRFEGADRGGVRNLAFTPDGGRLIIGGRGGTVQTWDRVTGKEVVRFPGGAASLAVSPDGARIATAPAVGDVVLRSLADGRELARAAGGGEGAYRVVFLPDGSLLAGCRDGTVRRFDSTGKEVGRVARDKHQIHAFVAAPDGTLLATHGRRRDRGFLAEDVGLRLWDLVSGREVGLVGVRPAGAGEGFAFSPDGRTLAVATEAGLRLYETATLQLRRAIDAGKVRPQSLAYAPGGTFMASLRTDGTVLIWDIPSTVLGGRGGAGPGPAELERLWADLNGGDAQRAFTAVCAFAAAPERSVPYLDRRVTAVAPLDTKDLPRLLREIDSKDPATRVRATRDLERFGPLAEPSLREALEGARSPELRQRVMTLLAGIQARPYSPAQVAALRLVEALELAGTPAARSALERLRDRGQPQYREPSATALGRLTRHPAR